MLLEIVAMLLAPYPGLEYSFLTEDYTNFAVEVPLYYNVVLLSLAMLIR